MHYSSALVLATAAPAAVMAASCSPVHFIYARATTEPPQQVPDVQTFDTKATRYWSKGYGAAGYSIFSNITRLIPGATGYPVHYPADWGGCASEDPGVADVLAQFTKKAAECPNQKFVFGGHSQGGVVTVRALAKVPAELLPRILAVTMVGSPDCPANVKDRCKSFCNSGDGICVGGKDASVGKCAENSRGKKGKGAKGPKGPMARFIQEQKEEQEMSEVAMPSLAMDVDCDKINEKDKFYEKGYTAKGRGSSHMLYSSDGYYVKHAACYVLKKYKEAGGKV